MSWLPAHDVVHDESRWSDPAISFGAWLQLDRRPERCTYEEEPKLRRGELELWFAINSEVADQLSPGELVVHELTERGLSSREIAQGLGVSVRAVRTQQNRAARKLQVAA